MKIMTGVMAFAAVMMLAGSPAVKAHDAHDHGQDIVETAVAAGAFETLVAAVQAAGLVETLQGEGPFTVFAPTDEAFAALPEGTVESLLQPENRDQLVAILTYHVVAGKVMAADVVNLTSAETVNGASVTIAVEDGAVKIDGATVIQADVEASNGVIHVIDQVILP
ncbi:MAG: fasciclin domain-containing protein [Gammaproteobacteria bacterium]|nr:fasciclin domain-containing protein [Gammaproteobacteria bacterium]TVQ48965.1 MAG: fasciclin domain-containing protein [Gammaproteobacteria bacterium]